MRGHSRISLPSTQRGAILLITLMAMLILMITSVAMVRSFDTSVLVSGGLALKRDMLNQGERGIAQAVERFRSGGALENASDRLTDKAAINYSSHILPSQPNGIPNVLLNDNAYASSGMSLADIVDNGVRIRTVIDRQCSQSTSNFSTATCSYVLGSGDVGGTNWLRKGGSAGTLPIYRISVRVTGPHNTQIFLQSTLSR